MSQPGDLVKLSRAFKPGVLLSRATIDEMAQPVILKDGTPWIGHNDTVDYSFGYCWELVRPKGGTEWIYTKGGAISGFFPTSSTSGNRTSPLPCLPTPRATSVSSASGSK